MAYNDPTSSEDVRAKVGLDEVLVDLREAFNGLEWLSGYVFLRAYLNEFPGPSGKSIASPQVYIGRGEYKNVMINDNFPCAMFFRTVGSEKIDFKKPTNSVSIPHTRNMALVFWCNMLKVFPDGTGDYIFTEVIKKQLMTVLAKSKHVLEITDYIDDPIEEVFKGYDLPEGKQYGKYPIAACRIDFTVHYKLSIRC